MINISPGFVLQAAQLCLTFVFVFALNVDVGFVCTGLIKKGSVTILTSMVNAGRKLDE